MFYEYYRIIDNILSKGFWYCRCYEYSGCPIVLSYLKNDKRYCCVCQLQDDFSFFELHEVKRFRSYLKQYPEKYPFYSEEQCFWNKNVHYTLRNNYLNELIDYLLNLDD